MIKEIKGLKIEIDESELFLLEGETSCINNIEKYCKDLDMNLIIDIGANVGCFSLVSAVATSARQIVSVEANMKNFGSLCYNIYSNNLWGHIIPLPYAVYSESNKLLPLSSAGGNSGQHSLQFLEGLEISNYIRTISLPDLCRNYGIIDYMKVDIEGGEYDVFTLTEEVQKVLQRVKFLEIELHSPANEDYFNTNLFLKEHSCYNDIKTVKETLIHFIKDCGFEILHEDLQDFSGMCMLRNKHLT